MQIHAYPAIPTKLKVSWLCAYAIKYLAWCQLCNSIWIHDLDDTVFQTVCFSPGWNGKLARVRLLMMCFWVCVSDRGYIVVESGGGTQVQSRQSSAVLSVCVMTYCVCVEGCQGGQNLRSVCSPVARHIHNIKFQRKSISMYIFVPVHSMYVCIHILSHALRGGYWRITNYGGEESRREEKKWGVHC